MQQTKSLNLKQLKKKHDNILNKLSKQEITHILYDFSKEDIIKDFEKLNINELSKYGSDFVNYFTAIERLDTKGRRDYFFLIQLFYTFSHL